MPGGFPMCNRCLSEQAFAANGHGAVSPEVTMKPEVATVAIGKGNKKDGMAEDEIRRSRRRHCE